METPDLAPGLHARGTRTWPPSPARRPSREEPLDALVPDLGTAIEPHEPHEDPCEKSSTNRRSEKLFTNRRSEKLITNRRNARNDPTFDVDDGIVPAKK